MGFASRCSWCRGCWSQRPVHVGPGTACSVAASGRRSAATLDLGRYLEARSRLVVLSARWPADGEVYYHLGDCESKLGDERAAVAAWSRVDDASPLSGLAAVRLARRALRTHRFAEAEDLMRRALGDRGRHAIEARETLVNLFKIQGRYREAEQLVRGGADRYPDKIGLLKELAQLGSINPHKLDLVRDGLEKAASTAPDDDRVWLGRANLATRTGQYEEAAEWLDRCRRRPDDPAVWRGRLELAMATDDAEGAREALRRLPGNEVAADEVLELCAWFAAAAGDAEREEQALRRLVWAIPDHRGPWSGWPSWSSCRARRGIHPPSAPARRSSTGPRRSTRFCSFRPDAASRPAPIARFAEALGRRQEARILWKLALARSGRPRGDRGPLPASDGARRPPAAPDPGALLADLEKAGPPAARAAGPPRANPSLPRRRRGRRAPVRLRQRAGRRSARSPRRWAAASACSTTTATAGSTSTSSRGGRSRPSPRRPDRPATACSATGATARSRTSPARRASPRFARGYGHGVAVGDYRQRRPPRPVRHPLAVVRPLPQPGRRHVRGRDRAGRASAATATGRPRRPSPTSTATATSTSTSATTSTGTPSTRTLCRDEARKTDVLLRPARASRRCPTTSSATTAAGSST